MGTVVDGVNHRLLELKEEISLSLTEAIFILRFLLLATEWNPN